MDEIERKVWGWTIEQEKDYLPNPNYLSKHPDLPPTFRYILFDWIFEVKQLHIPPKNGKFSSYY